MLLCGLAARLCAAIEAITAEELGVVEALVETPNVRALSTGVGQEEAVTQRTSAALGPCGCGLPALLCPKGVLQVAVQGAPKGVAPDTDRCSVSFSPRDLQTSGVPGASPAAGTAGAKPMEQAVLQPDGHAEGGPTLPAGRVPSFGAVGLRSSGGAVTSTCGLLARLVATWVRPK